MATAVIDTAAAIHNTKVIRQCLGRTKLYVIASSDAFGHGAVTIAKALEPHVDGFSVSRPAEAYELRAAKVNRPILLFGGSNSPMDLNRLARQACDVVVHNDLQLSILENTTLEYPIGAWLELDLGLHATGFRKQSERINALERLKACTNVLQPVNVIARVSDEGRRLDKEMLDMEAEDFSTFTANIAGQKCLITSSSISMYADLRKDVSQVGRLLYGICSGRLSSRVRCVRGINCRPTLACASLRPVMTLKARLIAVRGCVCGERVGHDGVDRCEKATKLGVVSIGYGDGYPDTVRPQTPMLVNNRWCYIIGNPTLDVTVVDLGPDATDQIGDEVICWGHEKLTLEMICDHLRRTPEALCSALTRRVPRMVSN